MLSNALRNVFFFGIVASATLAQAACRDNSVRQAQEVHRTSPRMFETQMKENQGPINRACRKFVCGSVLQGDYYGWASKGRLRTLSSKRTATLIYRNPMDGTAQHTSSTTISLSSTYIDYIVNSSDIPLTGSITYRPLSSQERCSGPMALLLQHRTQHDGTV